MRMRMRMRVWINTRIKFKARCCYKYETVQNPRQLSIIEVPIR